MKKSIQTLLWVIALCRKQKRQSKEYLNGYQQATMDALFDAKKLLP